MRLGAPLHTSKLLDGHLVDWDTCHVHDQVELLDATRDHTVEDQVGSPEYVKIDQLFQSYATINDFGTAGQS